jgi:hypothetical protein
MIYELDAFLSLDECTEMIDFIKNKTSTIPFTNSGKFKSDKWFDSEFTDKLFATLSKYNIHDNIIRPNNIVMSGMYKAGDSFSLHTDTGLYYNKQTLEETRWTLLIYLNDDFDGGQTTFYNDDWTIKKIIVPKTGMCILFDIDLWHKGNEILTGEKYWIGCEIVGAMIKQKTIE